MRYLVFRNERPLIHISSGQLLNEGHFRHPRRNLDTWVLIFCTRGKLHLVQDGLRYTLTENQYIILFAGHEHSGFKESEEELSYYWCHFRIPGNYRRIMNGDELNHIITTKHGVSDTPARGNSLSRYFILPEYGDLPANHRALLIFRQLLDLARGDCYSSMLPNYALSLLAMEISQEFAGRRCSENRKQPNPRFEKMIEWIRVNYNRRFTLEMIAKKFLYNPDYLSTAFKKYTGLPLMKYVNMVRISNAKKLLLENPGGIKEIAWEVGFDDEKAFLKRFKKQENITPTTYRNAFIRAKIVKT